MDGLPAESLTLTRIRDQLTPEDRARLAERPREGHGTWSSTDMHLARIADLIRVQTWQLTEWAKGKRPPPPEPTPRPGVDALPARRVTSVEQLKARVSPRVWEIAEAMRRGETPPGQQDN